MASKKTRATQRQPPPWQFRPGPELEQLVTRFAAAHQLQPNEAVKMLVSLAITELDVRYYPLLHQMAEAMGGASTFVRACSYVHTALDGARQATGRAMQSDPERCRFIIETIQIFLAKHGITLRTQGASIPSSQEEEDEQQASAPQRQPVYQRVGRG